MCLKRLIRLRDDTVYIRHILDETSYLINTSRGISYERFVEDETLKRAFARSLEIIGEASKNISSPFKQAHPDIKWKAVAGLRDKLIHQYFGVEGMGCDSERDTQSQESA